MLKHQERNVLGKLSISFAGVLILGSTLVAPMTEAAEVPVPGTQDGEITHYIINDNVPYFTNDELLEVDPGYTLSDLDELGRVQVANATLSEDIMPAEERGSIRDVTPTGWNQNAQGDEVGQVVPGGWLYNRSHMIGHQLSGLNDEKENLITGTKFFNNYAMLPIENFVTNYIEEENESVRYRVTPHFEGDNLLASGMFMEGLTLHDIGDEDPDIMFNIYVPNIQPGVTLNYADGSNSVGETNAVVIPTHPHAKNFEAVTPPEEDDNETVPPVEEDDGETTPPVEEDDNETVPPVENDPDPEVPVEDEEDPDTPVENDLDTPVEDEENPEVPVEDEEDPDTPVENDSDETTDNESIEEDPDAPVENDGNEATNDESTDEESIEEDVATDDESIEEDVATDDESIEEDVTTDDESIEEDVTTDDESTLPADDESIEEDVTTDDESIEEDVVTDDESIEEDVVTDDESVEEDVVTDDESVEEDVATDDESVEEGVATEDVTTDDEATLPVEEDNVETTLPEEETVTSDDQHVASDTQSTDDTASEIDTDLSTIHDGSSIQKPVIDEDVDELPETGSGAPEIGLIASAMALIIGAGLALFKRRESNNN